MKKITFLGALLIFPIAAQASDLPSKATAPKAIIKQTSKFDGYLGGDIGYQSTKTINTFDDLSPDENLDVSGMAYGVHGAFEAMLSDQYGFQMDASFKRTTHEISGCTGLFCTVRSNSPSIAGHAFWRDSTKGLIGAFGQYTSATELFGGITGYEHTYAGIEGQYFLNNLTLYGQIAYVNAEVTESNAPTGDGYALAGQGRYFINHDLMIALRATYTSTQYKFLGLEASDNSTTEIGIRAEYRMANNPVSIYADASYAKSKVDPNGFPDFKGDMDETRVMIGANFNFGGTTLFERDRSGASLNMIEFPHSLYGTSFRVR